jgi:hypothetical protein
MASGEKRMHYQHLIKTAPSKGGQGGRAPGGGVARPHPLEHDTQPYEYDQRELVEEQMRYHGKTPPYTGCNEVILPGLSGC